MDIKIGMPLIILLTLADRLIEGIAMAVLVLLSTAIGIVSWCCEGGVVYFTALALENKISFLQGVFAVLLSGIFAAMSMIPDGIGIAYRTTLSVLLLFHIPYDIAGGITLVSRFSVMRLGLSIGAMTLLVGWKNGLTILDEWIGIF